MSRKFRVWRDNSCVVPIYDGRAPCRPLQQYQLKTDKIVRRDSRDQLSKLFSDLTAASAAGLAVVLKLTGTSQPLASAAKLAVSLAWPGPVQQRNVGAYSQS